MLIASNTLKKLFLKQGPKYFFARFDDTKIPEREINIRRYKTHFNTLYFQKHHLPRLVEYDSSMQYLIKQMLNDHPNKGKVKKALDRYLNEQTKDRISSRTLILLSTVIKSQGPQFSSLYSDKIAQKLIRIPIFEKFKCDFEELVCLIDIMYSKWSTTNEKIKITLLKYKIMELIKYNIEAIEGYNIPTIIKYILKTKSTVTSSEHIRYASIAILLEQKITTFLEKQFLADDKPFSKQFYCLEQISYCYLSYIPKQERSVKAFYNALSHLIASNHKGFSRLALFKFYKYFPYTGKTSEGVYYRDMLLDQISRLDLSHEPENKYNQWNEALLCYAIISFQFYKHFQTLSFRYEDNFNYLLSSDIQAPDLGDYFWKLYRQKPRIMNQSSQIFHEIIKTIYPDKYVESAGKALTQKGLVQKQNQIITRLNMALDELGYQRELETVLSGRYVDIYISSENIILECDGDHHFNMHKMEFNEETQFRNMHLLLSGYKLVILNIFEYNRYRYPKQLAALIKQKIDIMKKHSAIIVI